MQAISSTAFSRFAVGLYVSLSLSVTFYFFTQAAAPRATENVRAFSSYVSGMEGYKNLRQEWRTRLFANWLAGKVVLVKVSTGNIMLNAATFAQRVAAWNAAWFFITCCVLVAARYNALFYVFGFFGALCYAFTPAVESRIYPWDLPALFFYTLLLTAAERRQRFLLLLVLAVGTGFKETVAAGCICFLFFRELPTAKRAGWFCAAGLLCAGIKITIDLITDNPSTGLTMSFTNIYQDNVPCILLNLASLFSLQLNHPVFINAGTLLVFLFLPHVSRDFGMWKTIAAVCIVGNFVCGIITEFRIFFETIPLCMWGLEQYLQGLRPSGLPSPEGA